MHRRTLLRASLAAALPAPAFAQGAAARTLRVIPQANLTSLDPVWTTAVVTRNHAFLVYDQLCAQDAKGEIRPQMAEGWAMEQDGLAWTFTLRDGLRFHDGEKVLAQGLRRQHQALGAARSLRPGAVAGVAEVEALDDRRFRFRLHRPLPLLLMALGADAIPLLHHAGAHRRDRRLPADPRGGGQRPLPLRRQ